MDMNVADQVLAYADDVNTSKYNILGTDVLIYYSYYYQANICL